MVRISHKVLLALLISTNSWAQDCRPSLYQYKDQTLCFSLKYKSYFTQDCADGKCGAIELIDKKSTLDMNKLTKADSRHPGAKACVALGGMTTVVTSPKTKDEICLCLAQDQSGVSCSRLGLR